MKMTREKFEAGIGDWAAAWGASLPDLPESAYHDLAEELGIELEEGLPSCRLCGKPPVFAGPPYWANCVSPECPCYSMGSMCLGDWRTLMTPAVTPVVPGVEELAIGLRAAWNSASPASPKSWREALPELRQRYRAAARFAYAAFGLTPPTTTVQEETP